MRKPRAYAEVYNDLDGEVVNVFRVLRSESAAALLRNLLQLTPFSREEFLAAYEPCELPVEQARRTILKSFAGFGSAAIHDRKAAGMRTRASTWRAPTGFRSNSNRSGTLPAHDWFNYPDQLEAFVDRLRGVVIEHRDALELIPTHDSIETLFFVDPPYPAVTRDRGADYTHEMTDDDHRRLAATLRDVAGMVLLSGYACDLYDRELYSDWHREQREHLLSDGARKRTEVLWMNAACVAALAAGQSQLEHGAG
jgi:DNA adenine methylase